MTGAFASRATAVVAILSVQCLVVSADLINCGGHYAQSCGECPEGNGYTWCNGQCTWHPYNPFDYKGDGDCVLGGSSGSWGGGGGKSPLSFSGSLVDLAESPTIEMYCVGSLAVSAIVMLIFACVYYSQVVTKLPVVPRYFNFQGRDIGLCACFADMPTCLHVTFCLPVVVGKNYRATEVMSFWSGCCVTFLLSCHPLSPCFICIRTLLALKVQERVGQQEGLLRTCLLNAFCLPCEVGRESIEVDQEIGAEITCCCKVKVTPRILNEASNATGRFFG